MAEYISGSEEKFVKLMNKKAKELGLKNTVFKNSTGLDTEGHISSAYDMAVIARALLSHKEILNFSSVYEDYLRVDTPNKFWLVNTNKLVRTYSGADGLKTGHTDNAGYCLAVTAKKDNMRLIAIVLGEETAAVRNKEASELLDYGFNNKELKIIKEKNNVIKKIKLENATRKEIKIYPKNSITVLNDKGINKSKYKTKVRLNKIKLPLNKNDKVGKMIVYENKKIIKEEDLITKDKVEKLTFLKLFIKNLKNIPKGIIKN